MANFKPVIKWDDNYSNQQNTGLTAYAISKLFSGKTPVDYEGNVILNANKIFRSGFFYMAAGSINLNNTATASEYSSFVINLVEDQDECLSGGHVVVDPKSVHMKVRQMQYSTNSEDPKITTRTGCIDPIIASLLPAAYVMIETVQRIQETCSSSSIGSLHYGYLKDLGIWIRYTVSGARVVDWEPAYTWTSWTATSDGALMKADKVNGAANGNLAGLNYEGNLTDSGIAASNVSLKGHTHEMTDVNGLQAVLNLKVNLSQLANVAISGSYTDLIDKPTIPTLLSQLGGDSTHRTVTDADIINWNSKGGSSEAQAKVDEHNASSNAHSALFNAKANVATTLSGYGIIDAYTKTESDQRFEPQEPGKHLSSNDYTTEEKTKLAGIEAGAQVNVKPNWNQNNPAAADYILNKPTITTPVQSDWNETNTSSLAYIKNKPSIGGSQIQSDWNQTDNTAADFIKNKPTQLSYWTSDAAHRTVTDVDIANWNNKSNKYTTLSGYGISNAYTKAEVDALITGGMHYKGTVNTYADLPASPQVGDMYIVKTADPTHGIAANDAVIFSANLTWDVLHLGIDLSDYVPKTRKVNNYPLSDDVNLTYTDVGAAATNHIHEINDVTNLAAQLNSKEATGVAASLISVHNSSSSAHSALFAAKANVNHSHPISAIINLQSTLNNKYDKISATTGHIATFGQSGDVLADSGKSLSDFASTSHTHPISAIINLQSVLDSKVTLSTVNSAISSHNSSATAHSTLFNAKSDKGHKHDISDVDNLRSELDGKEATGVASTLVSNHNSTSDAHSALFAAKADTTHSHGHISSSGVVSMAASPVDTDPVNVGYLLTWISSWWANLCATIAVTISKVWTFTAGIVAHKLTLNNIANAKMLGTNASGEVVATSFKIPVDVRIGQYNAATTESSSVYDNTQYSELIFSDLVVGKTYRITIIQSGGFIEDARQHSSGENIRVYNSQSAYGTANRILSQSWTAKDKRNLCLTTEFVAATQYLTISALTKNVSYINGGYTVFLVEFA